MKQALKPVLLASLWIAASEFIRNQLLFLGFWQRHYQDLGLQFSSGFKNGLVWMLWSLGFAAAIYFLSRRFNLRETTLIAWFMGFVLMWLTIGNLDVLPFGILWVAVPWSLFETYGAVYIIKSFTKTP